MKIGITNLKGGVGKTTISINLAVCLAHAGYKVCIVDTDVNQTSLKWYGVRDEKLPEVSVLGAIDTKALNKAVEKLHESFDVIIIDGTPSLSEMTTRIIISSDLLLIPIRPGANDFRTMDEFLTRYNAVKEIKGEISAHFLLNEYSERINVHKTIKDTLISHYGFPVLDTVIKSRTAYVESCMMGTGVFEHTDLLAKKEMLNLTEEIIRLAENNSLIKQVA
ncbi:ParA family partition ATPase [soil metagenome]